MPNAPTPARNASSNVRIETEDITILDHHVFPGMLFQPFGFVSGVKIEFSG